MQHSVLVIAAALFATAAQAQEPDWSHAQRIEVRLSSFRFDPAKLHLRAGQPLILHLENTSNGGHNFSAPEFFASSIVRAQDKHSLKDGTVELDGHATSDIWLVPRAGQYRLRCTHMMHSAFGMKGQIIVE